MRPRAVLIDLGGTLVDFFGQMGHAPMLPLALRSLSNELVSRGHIVPPPYIQETRWDSMKRDPSDLRVKLLEDRLANIFDLDLSDQKTMDIACRAFMRPVYEQARLFEDALPFLNELRTEGFRTVLVSNTTWGSPAYLWREELDRYGLTSLLDRTVFCRDVGWRKPDRRIFDYAADQAGCSTQECIFIGDDPVWDIEGPTKLGMKALLVDRRMEWVGQGYKRTTNLNEILEKELLKI
jgi:putative hydrolase of the HAD superfamily